MCIGTKKDPFADKMFFEVARYAVLLAITTIFIKYTILSD